MWIHNNMENCRVKELRFLHMSVFRRKFAYINVQRALCENSQIYPNPFFDRLKIFVLLERWLMTLNKVKNLFVQLKHQNCLLGTKLK